MMNKKYARSILMRRQMPLDDIIWKRNPKQLYDFHLHHGHQGEKPFHSQYDSERYQVARDMAEHLQIDGTIWPYYDIEHNFYQYNQLGYRTHDFHGLPDQVDLVMGAEDVEGIGVRSHEHWVHAYEQQQHRTLVNLGKAGVSNLFMKWNLQAWLLSHPVPQRVLMFWTEPSRTSYHVPRGKMVTLQYGNQRCEYELVNSIYKHHLQDVNLWTEEFLDIFISTNLMLSPITQVYNFFSNLYWTPEVVQDLQDMTQIPTHYFSWNMVTNGWAKFQDYQYHPASDLTHHGWQHHQHVAGVIQQVMS